jgi:hypothetical protein
VESLSFPTVVQVVAYCGTSVNVVEPERQRTRQYNGQGYHSGSQPA